MSLILKRQVTPLLNTINQASEVYCFGANAIAVQIVTAPSAAAVQLIFEGRIVDTAPWVTLASRTTDATAAGTLLAQPAALSAVPTFGWFINTAGFTNFRIRVVSVTAGGVTAAINYSEQPVL